MRSPPPAEVARVVEAITRYPKWTGALSTAPRVLPIAREEFLRIYRNTWTMVAVGVFVALAVIMQVATRASGLDQLADALRLLEWGALGVAAVGAGPALLDDARKGALELYLSRGATRTTYLLGKALGVWGIVVLAVFLPGIVYYGSGLFGLDEIPIEWRWAWAGILGHALIWGTVVAGLGLGLSVVMRSSRAASLVLFGAVFGLDVFISTILTGITRNDTFQILSPIANLMQQNAWLFPSLDAPFDFPFWWGLIVLGGIALVGWGLFVLRAPRVKGVD